MEENNDKQLDGCKRCPYCAEKIQAAAIKCRYCGEFLDEEHRHETEVNANIEEELPQKAESGEKILFRGRPSVFGMFGQFVKAVILLIIAWFLISWPLEKVFYEKEGFELTGTNAVKEYARLAETELGFKFNEQKPLDYYMTIGKDLVGLDVTDTQQPTEVEQEVGFGYEDQAVEANEANVPTEEIELVKESSELSYYRKVARVVILRLGLGWFIAGFTVLRLFAKTIRLKSIYYEVTPNRIERGRGILSREVDNLDMFRLTDLKLRRTILDCLFGIGQVELITTDKSDPDFKFEKMHRPRKLYDILKNASLEADKSNGVVHLEE